MVLASVHIVATSRQRTGPPMRIIQAERGAVGSLDNLLRAISLMDDGRVTLQCQGIDLLVGRSVHPYEPYRALMHALCAARGCIVAWVDTDEDLPGHEISVGYYAIGGEFATKSPLDSRAFVLTDMRLLSAQQMKRIIDFDSWVGLWKHSDAPHVSHLHSLLPASPYPQEVTNLVLGALRGGNDLVAMAVHDGNPINFYLATNSSAEIAYRAIGSAEDALSHSMWVTAHRNRLRWDDETLGWELEK